jgi:hypothetical protein
LLFKIEEETQSIDTLEENGKILYVISGDAAKERFDSRNDTTFIDVVLVVQQNRTPWLDRTSG